MKIDILTVGKIKENYLKEGVSEYSKRLSRYCDLKIIEVADESTKEECSEQEKRMVLDKEAERLEKHLASDAYLIALAIEGKQYTSEGLSARMDEIMLQGTSHIQSVIGGSLGLAPQILSRADEKLSFSKLTFPHQLMRMILLEQIYRSFRISRGEPYHK